MNTCVSFHLTFFKLPLFSSFLLHTSLASWLVFKYCVLTNHIAGLLHMQSKHFDWLIFKYANNVSLTQCWMTAHLNDFKVFFYLKDLFKTKWSHCTSSFLSIHVFATSVLLFKKIFLLYCDCLSSLWSMFLCCC